jgi:hypothetical protein
MLFAIFALRVIGDNVPCICTPSNHMVQCVSCPVYIQQQRERLAVTLLLA